MALQRSFSSMLNEFVTGSVLTESLVKRMWFFNEVEHKTNWKNGTYPVPFEGNVPTSIQFNGLTPANDIAEADFVRGEASTQVKATHSLIFNQEDLAEHDGKIPESTFIDVMERQIGPGMNFFKESLSHQMLCGPQVCTVTAEGSAASGIFTVDHIERLNLKQKLMIKDSSTAAVAVYVTAIDLNADTATFSLSRGGSAANLSAYTIADGAKLYHPGGESGTFTSMRQALLSLANGGAATLHSQTKLSYPYLQCINKDGSGITASNILEKLFDFYVDVRKKARGNANQLLMSYKHWGSVMKSQQIEKGAYKVVNDPKRSEYGWWETTIASTKSGETLTIVAIQEMDDDIIVAFDKASVHVASNGGVQKIKTPEGKEFYVVRNTTGYQYVVDIIFRGEVIWKGPTRNGIMHSISY
jgi:hypothetical protein